MRNKSHTRKGFEYYCERSYFDRWHTAWFFRPIGEPWWINYVFRDGEAKKIDLEALIERGEALDYYERAVARLADVEAAEKELERVTRRYAVMHAPGWDPGGSTNNPGKVTRDLREYAETGEKIKRAQAAVDAAKRFRTELQSARGLG